MRKILACTVAIVFWFTLPGVAQGKPGGGGGGGGGRTPGGSVGLPSTTAPVPTNIPPPNVGFPNPSFLSGKVVTDDGTPLTDSPVIQTLCLGTLHNEGYADQKGNFSFDLQTNSASAMVQDADTSAAPVTAGTMGRNAASGQRRRDLRQCSMQAVLPGFRSDMIELASKANDSGNADVGTIVLHRLAKVEGLTISVTSAAAPGKAKKEYEKGRQDEAKSKWDSAQEHFSKAVEIYPKYAVAWNELGRVQMQKTDLAGASDSFQKSIAADGKFINPLAGLVEIALKNQQWKQLVELTDKIVALNGVDFPQYWFDNSLGNYFLGSMDAAQKSAERGIAIDKNRRVPRLEYALAMILVKKKDYAGALTHVQNYLRLEPNASDRQAILNQEAELQKLSTTSQLNRP